MGTPVGRVAARDSGAHSKDIINIKISYVFTSLQVGVLLQTDKTKQALSVCKKGTERFNSSVSLWSEYLRLKVINKGNDLVFGLFFHSIVSM